MKKYEEQLTKDAVLLDQYLSQYSKYIDRKKSLEGRRKELVQEFNNPLKGVFYDGMPHGSGKSLGCAALSFRLDEINTRIKDQMEKSAKVLVEIMDIIEFLPENSTERAIVEHRYIDRFRWEQICKVEHISRTPATRYWKKGLYQLLDFKKVQKILRDYVGH